MNRILLALVLATLMTFSATALPSPVFYEPFDSDATISANGGTKVGGPGFVDGIMGNAINIASNGQKVYYPAAGILSGDEGTVSFWVNRQWGSSGNKYGGVGFFDWGEIGAPSSMASFYYTGDNRAHFEQHSDTGAGADSNANIFLEWQSGDWHQITITWSKSLNQKYIYIDGTSFVWNPMSLPFSPSFSTFSLGWCGWYESAIAYIDEVKIFDRVLTASEVLDLYLGVSAPQVEEIEDIFVAEGDLVTITVIATDPNGDPLSYDIDNPDFSQSDNVFTWQTETGDKGLYLVTITVSDGENDVVQTVAVAVGLTQKGISTGPVALDGSQLYVNGQPFFIKGVGYGPVPIGQTNSYDVYSDAGIRNRDFPILRSMGVNTIRVWKPVTNSAFLDAAYNSGNSPIYILMGLEINPNVNYADPATRQSVLDQWEAYITQFKDNPAVLGWAIGNEENYRDRGDEADFYSLANEIAAKAYEIEGDAYHPIFMVHGDQEDIGKASMNADDSSLLWLDAWASNIFRGNSFDTFFIDYKTKTNKPLIITEFGIDAYNHVAHAPYPETQAAYLSSLWDEIEDDVEDVLLGGCVFEYTDEWWKYINPSVHDEGGYEGNCAQPDCWADEEWWGLFEIQDDGSNLDILIPRQAYYTMVEKYNTTPACIDNDGDTYGQNCAPGPDCNDNDDSIHPGADETCNNQDDDCDGQTDEDLTDSQSCGLGICSGGTQTKTCTAGVWSSWSECSTAGNAVTEICDDGLDNDCDGLSDLDDPECASDGLIFYESFDSAATVSANSGTMFGTPTFVEGILGNAISLDGVSGKVEFPSLGNIDADEGTLIIWVSRQWPDDDSMGFFDWGIIGDSSEPKSNMGLFYLDAYSQLHFEQRSDTGVQGDNSWGNVTWDELGDWKQVAITWSKNSSLKKLYLNSGLVSEGSQFLNEPFNVPDDHFTIGWSGYYVYSQAYIDEVMIYDRVLSWSELQNNYYSIACPDADGDGYDVCGADADCNDVDSSINPGATEICNSRDDDCDGLRDEFLNDSRACGFGICSGGYQDAVCVLGQWQWSECSTAGLATDEICDDDIDNDCDDLVDSEDPNCIFSGPIPAFYEPFESETTVLSNGGVMIGTFDFVDGVIGNAIYVDTEGEKIEFPATGVLNNSQGAVSMWVNRQWNESGGMFDWGYLGSLDSIGSFHSASNTVRLEHKNSGGWNQVYNYRVPWDIGEWHHVVVMWDEATQEEHVIIDGLGTSESNVNLNLSISGDYFTLGWSGFYGSAYAFIDEVRIYDRVLTDAEIEELYVLGQNQDPNLRLDVNFNSLLDRYLDYAGDHTVTPVGTPEIVDGVVGDAVHMDGDDYITTDLRFKDLDTFTVDLWTKFDEVFYAETIISNKYGGVAINLDYHKKFQLMVRNEGNQDLCRFSTDTVAETGKWYHVIASFDGEQCVLAVNGEIATKEAIDDTPKSGDIYLGFSAVGPQYNLKGTLDEVKIYDKAVYPDGLQLFITSNGLNEYEDYISGSSGTPEGNPQLTGGYFGPALNYDGDDYVKTNLQLNNFDEVTFDFMVNFDRVFVNERIFQNKYGGNGVNIDWKNRFEFLLTDMNNQLFCRTKSDIVAEAGEWYHVIASFDGEECLLSVDGAVKVQESLGATGDIKSGQLYLGFYHVPGMSLEGTLDDFKVYDKVVFENPCFDNDSDGYLGLSAQCIAGTDCDDADPLINPGVNETCDDEIDNNCNGLIDFYDAFCRDIPEELRLRYTFDDLADPYFEYVSGSQGVPVGDPVTSGGNLAFNGDDYLKSGLQISDDFDEVRFDVRVNLDEVFTAESILVNKYGLDAIYLNNQGNFVFSLVNNQNAKYCNLPSDVVAQAGVWYNVSASFDGVTCRLDVNGAITTQPSMGATGAFKSGPMYLGFGVFGDQYNLKGTLDEVSIYDSA